MPRDSSRAGGETARALAGAWRWLLEACARWAGVGQELPLAPGESRLAVPAEARAARGCSAEDAAARYLRRRGLRILCRRRANERGELDVVALDRGVIVFVEVRSRREGSPVAPRDTVTTEKRQRLERCVRLFVRQHGLGHRSLRLDLVAVTLRADGRVASVEHLPAAFGARERARS